MVYKLMNERFDGGEALVEFVDNNHIAKDNIQTITADTQGCDLFYWGDVLN